MAINFFEYVGETSAKKVSEKLRAMINQPDELVKLRQYLIDNDADFNRDLFVSFFEQNLAERKGAKQDYTPTEVANLMWNIQDVENVKSVYDPTGGTGSLLVNALETDKEVNYNELDDEAYEFAKLNALLRNKTFENYRLGDALNIEDGKQFDLIIANPPYSLPYKPDNYSFTLFEQAGKKAPKSKADYAFISMIVDRLKDNGSASVLLPHGVLFRGAAEGKLREQLIKNNYLDAVIGLPDNLFFGTGIPTVLLILKKQRDREDVLFIDASKGFKKNKQVNVLTEEHQNKIIETYHTRHDIDKYAHVTTLKEIEENDFNLNIPRYVDTFEPEPRIDLDENSRQLIEINRQIGIYESELFDMEGQIIQTATGDPVEEEEILKKMSLLISLWEQRGKILRQRKQAFLQRMFV